MLLPIGSVVSIREQKFITAGYVPLDKKGQAMLGYVLLGYPLGFMTKEKTLIIPANEIESLIAQGFDGENVKKCGDQKYALLPVGSVVRLKDIPGRLYMITGYYPSNELYAREYSAVNYPNGMISFKDMRMFDGNRIEEIVWYGYIDKEAGKLLEKIPEFMEKAAVLADETAALIKAAAGEKENSAEEKDEISVFME